ncbi:LamG-like jellyroll fold domain-containing protein [Roseibacillus persicicus]|uniref:LamG-like jellyroll fold domain-containing protein n=1 Tax=Roseibacillus persicicus TaxID=454148 RepID=UPI00398A7DA3
MNQNHQSSNFGSVFELSRLALLSLFVSASSVSGLDLYVATDGDDSNDGSISAPYATLTAARDRVREETTELVSVNGATELTLAGWVFPDSKSDNDGIVSSTGSSYFGLLFSGYGSGNPLEFRAQGTGLVAPDNSCPAGQWHHVCGVWKSGQIHKLYIDGVEVADNPSPQGGEINADDWFLGTDRFISSRYLDGNIKGFRLWSDALSASEVAALATEQPTLPTEPVLSRLDEEEFSGNRVVQLNLLDLEPVEGGVNIWLRGGRYPATDHTLTLGAQDSGAPDSPLVFSAYPGEEVIFDGGEALDPLGFSLVTDETSLAKLHVAAVGKVFAQTITDPEVVTLLQGTRTNLSVDDKTMVVARYPNIGYGSVENVSTSGESVGSQGSSGNPVGASVRMQGNYDAAKWSAELGRLKKARLIGYVSADWFRETLRIDSIAESGQIRLMDGTRYGWGGPSTVERPFVERLLAELDEPGEWYFDDTDNKLYLWPRETLTATTPIRVWNGRSVFTLNGASHVHIKRITFQHNLYGNTVDITAGENNLVAGCTFRNMYGAVAFSLTGGSNNGVLSCDIYDVDNASRCAGGGATNSSITHAGNFIENCHFTQIYAKTFYGKVSGMNGAGNIFRNNLMHNHNGQVVTVGGQDHLIELNEVFNTGIEEGDGGSFYQGASATSWGNVFRHNFWHHIICIPSLIQRAAIFSDDGDQGDTVVENVFYKAGASFKMNQGAGHRARNNVFMSSIRSFEVLSSSESSVYNNYMNFLNNDPTSTAKDNLIGRGMALYGIDGWENTVNSSNWRDHVSPFWKDRYPDLETVNSNWYRDKAAYKWSWFSDNIYYANTSNFPTGIRAPAQTSITNGTTLSNLNDFEDPSVLNFKFKTPLPSYAPNIPFEQIGLYVDEYRTSIPDKDTYRAIVADHWKNTASSGGGGYNPATVGDRIYFNTGKLLRDLDAIPTSPPSLPTNVVADSIQEWQGAADQPQGNWKFGYYASGTDFTEFSETEIYNPERIGGDGLIWERAVGLYPRIGQFSMAPHTTLPAVRRWTSPHDGLLTVTVDARQIQDSRNNQTLEIRKDGELLETLELTGSNKHRVFVQTLDFAPGDKLDVSVHSLGEQSADWTSVHVRISNLHHSDEDLVALLPLNESSTLPEGDGGDYDRRVAAGDHSGLNHHALLENLGGLSAWRTGILGEALYLNGIDNYATLTESGVGNGASELTLSLWFKPDIKGDNEALISSLGTDYFSLILSGYGSGNPVEFRAKSSSLVGPDASGPVGVWTHAVGVWKSGEIQKLYLNGVEVASHPTPPSGTVDVGQWLLGTDRLLSDRYYGGALDDVAIWTRALSASDVAELHEGGLAGYGAGQNPGDTLSDNLPDDWQEKYFGAADSPMALPDYDADGDGLTNYEEWIGGNNPTDPNSRFQVLKIERPDDSSVSLEWNSVYGRTYGVEWQSDLGGNWSEILSGITPTLPVASTQFESTDEKSFFRVKAYPPTR